MGKVWNKKETKQQRDKDIQHTVSESSQHENFASNFVVEKMALGVMIYTKNISTRNQDPLLAAKSIVKTLLSDI
jgi:hypothetical protein